MYPDCKQGHKKLATTLELLQWKASNGLSDNAFEKFLKLIKILLPEDNTLPETTYEARKVVCPLGLEAQMIHACPNDCILYRGENKIGFDGRFQRRRVARHRRRDGERRERRTAGHASHVGEPRLAGFDETRGAGDGFGRGHGAWPTRRPHQLTDAVTARNREGGEREMVVRVVL